MKIVAMAARSFRLSTWLATGVWPATSPPVTDVTVDLSPMAEADVIYLCLHGYEGDSVLYGDGGVPAFGADQIPALPRRPVVYMAGCWGLGLVSQAFLDAGAAAVVADRNVNWAGRFLPTGSNGVGRLFLAGLRAGLSAGEALKGARAHYAGDAVYAELLETVALVGDERAVSA